MIRPTTLEQIKKIKIKLQKEIFSLSIFCTGKAVRVIRLASLQYSAKVLGQASFLHIYLYRENGKYLQLFIDTYENTHGNISI